MTDSALSDAFAPRVGVAEQLEPALQRILAPNPSQMTYKGTNTYLLGTEGLAVIDPGPANDAHLAAILAAVAPHQRITHIVVTHAHRDHSPLARPLAEATGAPVYAYGPATAGRSAVMTQLAATGLAGGGEGLDHDFAPDKRVPDGGRITGDGWKLDVIHTPGHIGNHICLGWGDVCLTGDHVMGWASSIVSPPDGDITDFMASCAKLQQRQWRVFHAGHGAPIHDPAGRLAWLIDHRQQRERAILSVLADGPSTPATIAEHIYAGFPSDLKSVATRNVFAHLVDLQQRNLIAPVGPLAEDAEFHML